MRDGLGMEKKNWEMTRDFQVDRGRNAKTERLVLNFLLKCGLTQSFKHLLAASSVGSPVNGAINKKAKGDSVLGMKGGEQKIDKWTNK